LRRINRNLAIKKDRKKDSPYLKPLNWGKEAIEVVERKLSSLSIK
jgi:hypothetical protein